MIAEEGGALSATRNEDALAGDTRGSIVQVFYRAGNQLVETGAE
jgi:hypothetical protein